MKTVKFQMITNSLFGEGFRTKTYDFTMISDGTSGIDSTLGKFLNHSNFNDDNTQYSEYWKEVLLKREKLFFNFFLPCKNLDTDGNIVFNDYI